jgi:hypothetical protein
MEEGKRGQGAVASSGSFLGGAGEAGGRWGSGNQADTWRKQGTSKGGGVPADRWVAPDSGSRPAGAGDVCRARAASRIEGEGRG